MMSMKEEKHTTICDLCDHNIGKSKCGLHKEVYKKARYQDDCDSFKLIPLTDDMDEPILNDIVENEDEIDEVENSNTLIDYLVNHGDENPTED